MDETVLSPGSWKGPDTTSQRHRPFVDRPETIISAGSWKTPVNMPQSARSGGPSGVSNHEYWGALPEASTRNSQSTREQTSVDESVLSPGSWEGVNTSSQRNRPIIHRFGIDVGARSYTPRPMPTRDDEWGWTAANDWGAPQRTTAGEAYTGW